MNAWDPKNEAWKDHAACVGVDPDLFFPDVGTTGRDARKVCAVCVVRNACLEYALAHEEFVGIWGGTSGRERRKMLRARTAIAVVPEAS